MPSSRSFFPRRGFAPLLLIFLIAGGLGCTSEQQPTEYVARVGDHYLTQNDLERRLRGMGPAPDSSVAREQVINQWVERTLLLREAKRLNLEKEPTVKRRLRDRRQSTLVTAMTTRIYDKTDRQPSEEEVQTYFERHRDELRLREPYVRVRHLATTNPDSARAARREILAVQEAKEDSVWTELVRRHAGQPDRAREIAGRFLPEGRLFSQLPYVQDELSNLREGQVAPVIEDNEHFHVLQLVRRIPKGTEPKLRWVEEEIRRRLRIRSRKQIYAREVQRLRNRAKADNLIETP